MFDILSITDTLAALIGLYFVAAGIGLLVNKDDVHAMLTELISQPMLGYLGGVLAFAIGGAIVGVHNNWNGLLAGFVSLVGWVSLIEGVLMLAARKQFLEVVARLALTERWVRMIAIATIVIGVVLVLAALA